MVELADTIAALAPQAEGNPAAMIQIARLMRKDGQRERALAQCRKALALAPYDAELAAKANKFLSEDVPAWHFSIVRDEGRNAAYDSALRRAIRPNSRVLEIGCGTGLLAMMAARAGAAEVMTCEMNPTIAEAAREIIARNGLADRVRVIAKHSDTLDVVADLGGPMDILVSEIVSNNLLGQDVLTAHERAMRVLLKPGARVIPARGAVRVALAYDAREDFSGLTDVAGFDLSAFTALAQPVRQIRVGHEQLSLRSEAADLFVFDFASAQYCAPSEASLVRRSTGGQVNGIAQWIALELDEVTRYENHPAPGAISCWAVQFYPLARTIDTEPGQEFRIFGSHDRQGLTIWAATDTPAAGNGVPARVNQHPHNYRISGLTIASELELPGAIPVGAQTGPTDVTIRRGAVPAALEAATASGSNWQMAGDRAGTARLGLLARSEGAAALCGRTWLLRTRDMFLNCAFAVPLLAIAILFFGAARFLPPVETGGESLAVLVGYTNRLIPLVEILLAGTLVMGMLIFVIMREDAIALQLRIVSSSSWKSKHKHIVIACLLCLFVIAVFPVWSDADGYFGQRLSMMIGGLRPYKDFEYAYGYFVAYLPYVLHLAGLSIRASLIVALCLFAVIGIVSFAVILKRCVPDPAARIVLFWLLVACEVFVEPGPSLNYNFGRYAMPFAMLSVLTESLAAFNIVQTFAAFAGAALFVYFVSPETGLGFSAALLAWIVVVFKQISAEKCAAAFLGTLVVMVGTPILFPEMFLTFSSFAQVQVLIPVVPNFVLVLVIICFLTVGAINFAVVISIWRGEQSRATALQLSLPAAYALLSAGLLPAIVGRSWPTMTIAYGFVPIVMSIGYLSQSGRKQIAWAIAGVFAAAVVYNVQFGVREDSGRAIHYLETACAAAHAPFCARHSELVGAHVGRAISPVETAEFLRANYPDSYDPLGILGLPRPGATKVGYYVGLTNVLTQQGLDRKLAELDRAPSYILPAKGENGAIPRIQPEPEQLLSSFAEVALYPFPLRAIAHDGRIADPFIAMLYQRCQPVAAYCEVVVCRRS